MWGDVSVRRQEAKTRGEAGTTAAAAVERVGWTVAKVIFVLVLPVALILGAVRFAFSWQPVYTYAVTAYHADVTTGISTATLIDATHGIRNYFSNDKRDLDIVVVDRQGQAGALFNAREIAHMRDVKALVAHVYLLLDAAVLIAALYVLATFSLRPRRLARIAGAVLTGSLVTVAVVVAFGVAAIVGFDQLFTEFHILSFSNNLWELDPTTDHLVQIFQQGFWFDITMFVGLVALLGALLLAAVSGSYLLLERGRDVPAAPVP